MRIVLLCTVFCFSFFTSVVANTCHGNCRKDSSKEHTTAFYSLTYGMGNFQNSPVLNNWLAANGFEVKNSQQNMFGFSESFFGKKWMVDYNLNFYKNTGPSHGPDIFTGNLGLGYKLLDKKLFKVYGILGLGLYEIYFKPKNSNPDVAYGWKSYLDQSTYLYQNAMVFNPHILLFRNITPNLSEKSSRTDRIGVGLEAGYNLGFWQGKWIESSDEIRMGRVFTGTVIPNSAFSGFYLTAKIGWYFSK